MITIFIRLTNDYQPMDASDARQHQTELERLVRDVACYARSQAAKMLAGTTHVTMFTESEGKP